MNIPNNITDQDLKKAIEKIDNEGIPPNAKSRYYDVLHDGKRYPPKLIVSYANLFANGEILDRNDFTGGLETECFQLLEKNHFQIVSKNGTEEMFYPELKNFLEQSETGNLKTNNLYKKTFKGLRVKVSFGQGVPARIPWISFLMPPHTTSEGIYPGLLNFRDVNRLILSFGVSETNKPPMMWPNLENKKSIKQYFQENGLGEPKRYGDSYVFKVYDTSNLPDAQEFEEDLDRIIRIYKSVNSKLPQKEEIKPLVKNKHLGKMEEKTKL